MDSLAAVLRTWQAVETATIERANEAMARTRSPLVELAMELIRRDCEMHRRVQEVLLDSLERLTAGERDEIWELVEMQAEKYAAAMGQRTLENCRLFVRTHVLARIAEDEHSHAVI